MDYFILFLSINVTNTLPGHDKIWPEISPIN